MLGVDGRAVVAAAERRVGAVVEEAALADLGQRLERLEVGVVAGRLAGQRDVHGVVEVVAPLRVEAVAAGLARA